MAYTFTPINFTGDTFTQAFGINDSGEIVGFHGATLNTGFMLTLPSSFTTVLPPGAKQSQLVGINNIKNTSVGFYIDGNGVTHGFVDAAGIIATQDEPGTNFNQLLGINDAGQEAGYSSMDTAGLVDQLAYLRQANGTYTLIDNATHTADLPTNVNSQATGVDDAGDVVGFFLPTTATSDGFLLTHGSTKPTLLQFPGSTFTQALGINNVGQVVGFYNDGNGNAHGFIWSNGNWTTVDAPGASMTTVNGINDKGQIVGFDTAGAATSGFVVNVPVALATDTTSHTTWQQALSPYTGPLSYLSDEFIDVNPDNLDLTATTPNVFLHSGPGEDALTVLSGQNVLDGGTGSNFLTDGSGTDTDFVDARGATKDIWSTMNNFHAGDSATVFGVTQAEFTSWANGQGAAGFIGLTTHFPIGGGITASLTLAGYSTADLSNGRLSVSFGTDAASGSPFMFVHAN